MRRRSQPPLAELARTPVVSLSATLPLPLVLALPFLLLLLLSLMLMVLFLAGGLCPWQSESVSA